MAAFVWAIAGTAAFGQSLGANSGVGSVFVVGDDPHAVNCVQSMNRGDTSDSTITECTRALRYSRLSPAAAQILLINRGITHLRRQEGEAALADFDAVLARNPRSAEAHINRGAALAQLRRYGEAVAAITQSLSLGVSAPHKAYFNRGAAREALGDLRGAYEDYSTALEIEPDWGPAEQELARFARTRRDHLASRLSEEDRPPPQ